MSSRPHIRSWRGQPRWLCVCGLGLILAGLIRGDSFLSPRLVLSCFREDLKTSLPSFSHLSPLSHSAYTHAIYTHVHTHPYRHCIHIHTSHTSHMCAHAHTPHAHCIHTHVHALYTPHFPLVPPTHHTCNTHSKHTLVSFQRTLGPVHSQRDRSTPSSSFSF